MTGTGQTGVQARLRVLNVLWLAFMAAVLVYTVVAYVVEIEGFGGEDHLASVLRLAFLAVSLVTAALSMWWRLSFALSPGNALSLLLKEPGGPLSPEEQDTVLGRLQTNCIIVWTFSESVALYGLVLAFVSGEPAEFLPFGCGALALLVLHRPGKWPIGRILGPGLLH